MKELLRRKSVRAGLLAIVLIVVVGIVGLNVRSAQRRKEYNGHVEAAEKYLTELGDCGIYAGIGDRAKIGRDAERFGADISCLCSELGRCGRVGEGYGCFGGGSFPNWRRQSV